MKLQLSRKLLATVATALALTTGFAAPAFAASGNGAAGTWLATDHGQGCWGGGSLFANNTAGGGGGCSFSTPAGQEVAKIQPVSWSFTDATHTAVQLNVNFIGHKGPVFPVGVPVPMSLIIPVNGPGAPIPNFEGDYVKVNIF